LKKTYLWIEDREEKAGFVFWKTMMGQLYPEIIVESKKMIFADWIWTR
jgi:hypothetical protein